MGSFGDWVGHPGLAPMLWWMVGALLALNALTVAIAWYRYRHLRPYTPEVKVAIFLPLAGKVCFYTAVMFGLVMLQLLMIDQAPVMFSILPALVLTVSMKVRDMTK